MIAGLFLYAARELAALYAHLGRPADEDRLLDAYDELLAAVEAEAWDGDWYLRAFDAAGEPVGTHLSREGKIFVESQAWCVLGGAGDGNGRARRALESMQEHLGTVDGVVLHRPPFTRYRPELGEISSYPPGYKENGSIFCHTNPWVTLSWCLLGEGDHALEYVPRDLPRDEGREDRRLPQRAVRLRADDRGAGLCDSRRVEELLADRNRGVGARRALPGDPRREAGLSRSPHRPLHPARVGVLPRHAPLPRSRVRDHRAQPASRELRGTVSDGRRHCAPRRSRPGRTREEHGAGRDRARRQPSR